MAKRHLPTEPQDRIGVPTIMDPSVAARFGVRYVHLAAYAIDVDRVRAEAEELQPPWPFGWEVFLTSYHLRATFDPIRDAELLEATLLSIIERGEAFGAQLPFAIYDLVKRGYWSPAQLGWFSFWKGRPDDLIEALDPLWSDTLEGSETIEGKDPSESPGSGAAARLAAQCLTFELLPPAAPPSIDAWRSMTDA